MHFFQTNRLTKAFGGLIAVNTLSFQVEEGEIYGLIGPNGSGKTTVFNLITGFYPITSGTISFKGQEINGLPTWKVCKQGIGRTFQIVKPLRRMTVLENVMTSRFLQNFRTAQLPGTRPWKCSISAIWKKNSIIRQRVSRSGTANGMEIARALATEPKLLLLDETMAGLTPQEQVEGVQLIRKIRNSGITIIIVEHIMQVIMNICDRILCINYGQEIARGTPPEVANNQAVIEAYLGKE